MDKDSWNYCRTGIISHPKAALIEQWSPPERTSGGLYLPATRIDKETRSAYWARLLKVSSVPTMDDTLLISRDFYSEHLGWYIHYEGITPVEGGYEWNKKIKFIAITDARMLMHPMAFYETIVAKQTDPTVAQELYEQELKEDAYAYWNQSSQNV